MAWLTKRYRSAVHWAIERRWLTVGVGVTSLLVALYLALGGAIGSEFLPHLDEGAIWVRGTLAPSTGPDEGIRVANQARVLLASFPEVTVATSQVGRPDDGTDTTGFFNTEYFVDLKPKEEWRPIFHQNKDDVIAAMNQTLEQIPGVIWNFSQPIADNMEEAVSGVKGQLALKIYGDDLRTLEAKGEEIVRINVADVQDAVQTAIGGNALTQVLQGERRYDLVMRYLQPYRDTREAIEQIRLVAPTSERVSLAQLATVETIDGASQISREANTRYVALKYSVRGRDLGSTVEEAIAKVSAQVQLPTGYRLDWAGEYESQKRSERRLLIVIPITILLIFIILYSMFHSFKWALLILANVAMARIGGLLALLVTGTNFSVSSGVGFLALFGVSVQTGVIMLEYINQLRARGHAIADAAVEGAILRLRPIMMTMLVATLGLLPAALSHSIGSDSQRPFAIVIVGGLIADLVMSVFLLPTLYVWMAATGDVLPEPEAEFDEGEGA
jgi:cobalt-zinc-cadmium resistance protein CzcA